MKNRMARDDGYMYMSDRRVLGGIAAVLVLVVVVFALVYPSYSKKTTATVTICGKESVQKDGGHEYRVYTSGGTYVVKDHVVNGFRTTSADTYGKIQSGKVYAVTSYGWRNGFLSMFKNIISAKRLDTKPPANACD